MARRETLPAVGRRSGMFDDPDLVRFVRDHAGPLLRTYPKARVWLVGCGSGEAAYGLAILLAECGLLGRCYVYATDTDPEALAVGKSGRYPAEAMRQYETDYLASGGVLRLSRYVTVRAGMVRMRPELRAQVVFAEHHLATDASFNECQLIIARGVLRQGSPDDRHRAYGVFHASLPVFGMLAVGRLDGFKDNPHGTAYQGIAGWKHVYRRIR